MTHEQRHEREEEVRMNAAGINAYRKTQVTTASPLQLVIQLYEGALRFVEQGLAGLEAADVVEAHNGLVRAQAVVTELRATLDPDAGEVARSLGQVYDLVYRQLVAANLRKDAVPARLALRALQELLDAWYQIGGRNEPIPTHATLPEAVLAGGPR